MHLPQGGGRKVGAKRAKHAMTTWALFWEGLATIKGLRFRKTWKGGQTRIPILGVQGGCIRGGLKGSKNWEIEKTKRIGFLNHSPGYA